MKHRTGSAWTALFILLTASAAFVLAVLSAFLEPVREAAGDLVHSLLLVALSMLAYRNAKRLRALEMKR